MAQYQVTCITKPHPASAHEHITHIGDHSGKISVQEAIRRMAGGDIFYVEDFRTGRRAKVEVYRGQFLRTQADGIWTDNLLSLPQCP